MIRNENLDGCFYFDRLFMWPSILKIDSGKSISKHASPTNIFNITIPSYMYSRGNYW